HHVTEGSRPIIDKFGPKFVTDADHIFQSFRSIGPHVRRLSRRPRTPDSMKEGFTCHHGTAQSILSERLLQPGDDLRLAIGHQVFSMNHVGVMSCPITYADLGEMLHHLSGRYRLTCWSMKERLPLIRCRPLWPADVVLPASVGRVTPAACL